MFSLCDSLRRGAEKENVESLHFRLFDVESPYTLFVSWTSAVQGKPVFEGGEEGVEKLLRGQKSA